MEAKDFINSIDAKVFNKIRNSNGNAECRRALQEHLQKQKQLNNMLISETLEERLINQIKNGGDKVDEIEKIFYIKEGTVTTSAMRSLKMRGWKGQFEIR
jgi:hypothetical protein